MPSEQHSRTSYAPASKRGCIDRGRRGLEPAACLVSISPPMPSFHHDNVEIAYLDEGRGEPIVLVHGFASTKEVNWVHPGWVATLTGAGRRVIALDNRGHGASSKLYRSGRLSQPPDGRRRARAARSSRPRPRPTSWAIRWARGSRRSWRWTHPERVRSVVLGGLGIRLVDGVGLPESIADALEAPSLDEVSDPQGRQFRAFADQTGSDRRALAACIRGSRQTLDPRAGRRHCRCRCWSRSARNDHDRGLGRGAGRAHSPWRARSPFPTAITCSRSATRCSRPAFWNSSRSRHDASRSRRPPPTSRARRATCSPPTSIGEEGPPVLLLHGGGQTRHAWRMTGDLLARHGLRRLCRRSARPRRFRMGRRRRLQLSRFRRRRAACWPTRWPSAAARGRSRSAPRSAASPALLAEGGPQRPPRRPRVRRPGAGRYHAAGRHLAASRRFRASCARTPRKASARSRKPPKRSPPICRTGRGRARTRA